MAMEMEQKLKVYKTMEHGKLGLGVKVVDEEATLADLLAAWEPLADDPGVNKIYSNQEGACRGCINNCCNSAYVIPDLIAFRAMCRVCGCTPGQFLDRYFHPQALKIGIPRIKSGPCTFLQERICSIYSERSLICRFYLCASLLGETEELVYSIATTGIAALYLWLENESLLNASPSGMTSFERMLLDTISQYREHPGTQAFLQARGYHEILLQPFLK
jgi:hypothetical protein